MNIKPFVKYVTLSNTLGLALMFGGCASVPNIDSNKSSLAPVKRITLLSIPKPHNVQIVNLGGAAGAFGVIGGAIQGASNADHSKAFSAAVEKRQVSLTEPLREALENSLRQDGYEVNFDQTQVPKKAADGKGDDYSDIKVDADAILVVWFATTGYMSSPYSTHYEPWVVIKARLIDVKTKKDLYFKTFSIGYEMKVDNAVKIPADPKYRYGSFDELMNHSDDAIAGLIDSEKIAAHQIENDLAK